MSLRNKLAIVGLSGVMFTGAAVGLSGIASAQGPEVKAEDSAILAEADAVADEAEAVMLDEFELSAEDEAVFEAYDECLVDNGFDESVFEAELDLEEEAAGVQVFEVDGDMEAAFEACESVLGDLGEELVMMGDLDGVECWIGDIEADGFEAYELSPEEEAMLEELEEGIENGDFVTFEILVDDDGEFSEMPEGDWAEGDWAEAEEFLLDDDSMVEMFEISPDELAIEGLEGCGGIATFTADADADADAE